MTDTTSESIHSCSYYCERPECIKRQRDEMRDNRSVDARDAELLALKMADRLCKEALPKFNWGASALDANAIKLLNEVPGLISAAIQREKEGK